MLAASGMDRARRASAASCSWTAPRVGRRGCSWPRSRSATTGHGYPARRIVGSLRPFTDYLITEVVDHQPARMRAFLFATAVVDRVNPSLARALSGDPDADRLLRAGRAAGPVPDRRSTVATSGTATTTCSPRRCATRCGSASPTGTPRRTPRRPAGSRTTATPATALEHWLAAGRPDEALRLAVEVGFALVDRGQAVTIEGIARRHPDIGAQAPTRPPARLRVAAPRLRARDVPGVGRAGRRDRWIGRGPGPRLVTQYLTAAIDGRLSIGAWDTSEHAAPPSSVEAVGRWSRGRPAGPAAGHPCGRLAGAPGRGRARVPCLRRRPADAGAAPRCGRRRRRGPWRPRSVGASTRPTSGSQRSAAAGDAASTTCSRPRTCCCRAIVARRTRRRRGRRGGDRDAAHHRLRGQLLAAARSPRSSSPSCTSTRSLRPGRGHLRRRAARTSSVARSVRGRRRVSRPPARPCAAPGRCRRCPRAAERMPPGLWRDVAIAKCLLAAGDTVAAGAILAPVSTSTACEHVVVEVLRALSMVDADPGPAHETAAEALHVAQGRPAPHGAHDRAGGCRSDREGLLGRPARLDGAGPRRVRRQLGRGEQRSDRWPRRATDRSGTGRGEVPRRAPHGSRDRRELGVSPKMAETMISGPQARGHVPRGSRRRGPPTGHRALTLRILIRRPPGWSAVRGPGRRPT